MTEQAREFSGKTVEDAIAAGLSALNATENQVEIEIVNKGSRGILGFGSEPALVNMMLKSPKAEEEVAVSPQNEAVSELNIESEPAVETTSASDESPVDTTAIIDEAPEDDGTVAATDQSEERDAVEISADDADDALTEEMSADDSLSDEDLTEMASELLKRMIDLMGFDAEVYASWQEADETTGSPYLLLDIRGDNLGALIGRRGETLASIQYLLRLMVNQQVKQWKNIVVDVEQYKQRRVNQLSQLAERMARQVAETGRSVTLEPMPGNERRIVHMTLRDDPDVFTESTGEGERRKVNIFPRHD